MIQLSLEISDRTGELLRAVSLLGAKKIDIKALFVSRNGPTPESGYLRMIVTDPQAAIEALKQGDLTAVKEEVVVAAIEDHPGGLAAALTALAQADITLTYAYSFVSRVDGRALAVLGVQDPQRASELLRKAGIKLVEPSPSDDSELASYIGGQWNW